MSHPFTNSGFVGVRDVEGNLAIADLLNKPEDCCLWREQIGQYIDQADSAYQVFLLLNKPYMLTFLKYTAPSLSERDLGQILANAWILNEMPNMDPNISKRELVSLFRSVSPGYLMDEGELRQYQELEDTVTVYRGVTSYNAKKYQSIVLDAGPGDSGVVRPPLWRGGHDLRGPSQKRAYTGSLHGQERE